MAIVALLSILQRTPLSAGSLSIRGCSTDPTQEGCTDGQIRSRAGLTIRLTRNEAYCLATKGPPTNWRVKALKRAIRSITLGYDLRLRCVPTSRLEQPKAGEAHSASLLTVMISRNIRPSSLPMMISLWTFSSAYTLFRETRSRIGHCGSQ